MSGQTVPLTVKELRDTYGVLFAGYAISMIVYGFTLFQTYVYYSQYPHDRYVIKWTVGSLCLLDTIDFGLISHALYYYLILSYPVTPPLLDFTYTYCAEIGVSVLAIFIVQIYYSHRVWIASQNNAVAAGTAVISFAAFALGIAMTGIIAKNLTLYSLTTPQVKAIMASSQGLTFLSGVAAFAALSFYRPSSQSPAVEPMGRLYNIVVGYAITQGSLATTIQLGCFITFISMPSQTFWMPFHLVASKLFINSLLTMLNVREVHRGQGVNEDINSRKTDTTSTSSAAIPHLRSSIRFAPEESKPGINVVRTNVNGTTTSKVILEDNVANEDDDHRKRTDSKV